MSAMCNPPRTGDESYETFIKVKYNPASSCCTVALHVTFFYSVTVVHVDATSGFFILSLFPAGEDSHFRIL